jgi:sugar lactone lactonase YvrE
MKAWRLGCLVAAALAIVLLLGLARTTVRGFRPEAWRPPPAPGLRGEYERNDRLADAELWPVGGAGPEDIAIDADGRVYTGLEDGRILRLPPGGGEPEVLADTGGRPLGLELHPDGALVICDADKGLLRLGPDGALDTLVDRFEGEPFIATNSAAVAADGTIYFTVTSRRYGMSGYKQDLLEHSGTGRLFARRPDGRVDLLIEGLQFANGVTLDPEERYLLVAETGAYRIRRFWLTPDRPGQDEIFVDNLPGFPDNLSTGDGIFWVAMPSPRDRILDALLPWPRLRHVIARMPDRFQPQPKRHGFVLGFDVAGRVVHNLQDPSGPAPDQDRRKLSLFFSPIVYETPYHSRTWSTRAEGLSPGAAAAPTRRSRCRSPTRLAI